MNRARIMYARRSNASFTTPPGVQGSSSMISTGETYMGAYARQSGYDQSASYPSRGETFSQTALPAHHGSAGLNERTLRPDLGSRGLFSKKASSGVQRGYDKAMAVLSRDETFDPMTAVPTKDQNEKEVDDGPHDPNATVGAQQNSLYVLMKNDKMIYAKTAKEMMEIAAFIWQNICKVKLPMIIIPEKRKEFVYFRMMNLEDKMKALTLSENKALRKKMKLHFMGKLVLIKDLPVAPLPFFVAQPGTRQEALDALMPLRGIPYEDQIAARSDSIKNMLKSVVLSARKTVGMPAGSSNEMAGCFFDEPELREFIPMANSSGFARFTTVEFGEHPTTGKPTPGIRVYYGPDEAPMVYLLPLEDCTHISPAIVKTINDLFGFLSYEGFTVFDPKYGRGLSILKFRAMMSTSGRMIITVELALDDAYVGSFEEIVAKNSTDQRLLYQPIPDPPLIPNCPFMKENSLDEVPPIRDLMKYGGIDHLCRIRPALQRFYHQYGEALGVEGIYVTWYYVNERPVEWNRYTKIWHHACGSDFVSEFIMDVHLPMYPHICSIHFPHTQAFPKILKEIVEKTGVNGNSRVIVLSEYLFLAEFFGQKCLRTVFLKNDTTEHERDYLERTLPANAIKFLSPHKKPNVEMLEPGGDVVIIWGGNRKEKILRNIGLSNYRLVVFVRDGLKRVKQDKQDTFTSLATVARCLFPYMALEGAVAIDVEPQGSTMPALITFFSKMPSAPKIPEVLPGASLQPRASRVPGPGDGGALPPPPPAPIISKQPDGRFSSQRSSLFQSPDYQTPQQSTEISSLGPYARQYPGNDFGPLSTLRNKFGLRPLLDNDFGPRTTPGNKYEQRLPPGNEFEPQPPPGNKFEPRPTPGNKFEPRRPSGNRFEPQPTPGNKFEPLPTPGSKIEPKPFLGNTFSTRPAPGNKLDTRPASGSKFDNRPTPGDKFEPLPTPGDFESLPPLLGDKFGSRWPPDNFGPQHHGPPIIEPQKDNFSGSGPDLPSSSADEPANDADKAEEIMDFVWRNGGHKEISNMTPDRSLASWKMLFNLQKSLRNQRNKGRITFYPFWYHTYLMEYEPNVELPADVKRPLSLVKVSERPPAQLPKILPRPTTARASEPPTKIPRMDTGRPTVAPPSDSRQGNLPVCDDSDEEAPGGKEEANRKYDTQFICEYVWKNGGHAKVLKMKLDQSVEGWRLLRNIQKAARNRRRKGESVDYPNWYREMYIPQYEPYVVLPAEPAGS